MVAAYSAVVDHGIALAVARESAPDDTDDTSLAISLLLSATTSLVHDLHLAGIYSKTIPSAITKPLQKSLAYLMDMACYVT